MHNPSFEPHRPFDPEHPAAVGQALRNIIFDGCRSEVQRATDILRYASGCTQYSLTPRNLSQIFLALGNLAENSYAVEEYLSGGQPQREVTRLISIGRRQIDGFEPRNVAETLRGLAFIGRGNETLADALLARATGMIDEFSPPDLVTALGAVRLIEFDRSLFMLGVERVIDESFRESDFSDLELALGALYLADLGATGSAEVLIDSAMTRLDVCEVRHLGMLAAALTKLPKLPDGYSFAVADELLRRIKTEPEAVPAREPVQVLELLGRRETRHDRFLETFCDRYIDHLPQFSADEIRETARSLATLQHNDQRFFRAISEVVTPRVEHLEPGEIAVIAWAFSSLGIRSDGLFNRFADSMRGRYSELSPSAAANLAWAYTPLDNPIARSVVSQAGKALRRQEHDVMLARQLHIAELAVGLVPPGNCPEHIIRQAHAEVTARPMNGFEEGVLHALNRLNNLGIAVEPFPVVEGLTPDFVITAGDRKIILECDGSQYHLNAFGEQRGNDKIQDQVFVRCGYEVAHILDREWLSLSLVERDQLLKNKLGLTSSP